MSLIIMSDIESNCSENISNRDELSATEQRKTDDATKQQIDNATEHRNIGKKPFKKAQKPESLFKRQRCEALADEEQDKNLKDSILNENPVPSNITKSRQLDEYYKELPQKKSR